MTAGEPWRVRVKVCGITRLEDALVAVEAGADLLGFVFAPSPRRIDPESAARIVEGLPPGPERVGVFVDETEERIREIAGIAGLTMIQLHGLESPEMDGSLGVPVIRTIRVRDLSTAIEEARARRAPYLLVEPAVAGQSGGTGRRMDLSQARELLEALPGRKVFRAGGLGPDNVREAIEAVRPWGVDASSRLEEAPGRKSPELIRRFLEAVRTT